MSYVTVVIPSEARRHGNFQLTTGLRLLVIMSQSERCAPRFPSVQGPCVQDFRLGSQGHGQDSGLEGRDRQARPFPPRAQPVQHARSPCAASENGRIRSVHGLRSGPFVQGARVPGLIRDWNAGTASATVVS